MTRAPASISVVVPAYNEARWIAELLDWSGQTDPADEIIVDDGSSDGTIAQVERFGDAVRLVRQTNAGCAAAFNRGFTEASGEFVALCPADDVWEPRKLEWQRGLAQNPDVDVVFGRAVYFGGSEAPFPEPPVAGLQADRVLAGHVRAQRDSGSLRGCPARATSTARRLPPHRRRGLRFRLRALAAGARFYYDPHLVVRLRLHGGNLSSRALEIWEMLYARIREHAAEVDHDLARRTLARDLLRVGRCALGVARPDRAREAYAESLRHRFTVHALAARTALALPGADRLVGSIASRRTVAAES